MNEIVKYSNELNKVPLTNFNETDLNFFYAICSKVRNRNSELLTFDFNEIKALTNYKPTSNLRFKKDMETMLGKLIRCSSRFEVGRKIIFMNMFQCFELDIDEQLLTIQINESFVPYFNNLIDEFTSFELQQYISLKGVHSKSLYRVLKQWKTIGKTPMYSVEQIKIWLDIPNYETKNIYKMVLAPACEEIKNKKAFSNLWVEPVYARKRGKPLDGYIFHFSKNDIPGQMYFDASTFEDTKNISKNKYYTKNKSNFNNFEQHKYDFDDLEKKLISN